MQPHRAALGDLQGFGEVRGGTREVGTKTPKGSACKKAEGQVVLSPGSPQTFHRSVQKLGNLGKTPFLGGCQGEAKVRPAQGELIEADVMDAKPATGELAGELQRVLSSFQHLTADLAEPSHFLRCGTQPGETVQTRPVLRLRPTYQQITELKTWE